MSVEDKIVLVQPVNNELGAEGNVLAELTEGSHKIANELTERTRGGKKDYKYGVTDEEFSLSFNYVKGNKGQEQLKEAIQKKIELKVWMADRAVTTVTIDKKQVQGHEGIFARTVVEEYNGSFDDEESTIEVTLKVRIETVNQPLPKLPDSILNPEKAVAIAGELPGETSGPLESIVRKGPGAGPGAGTGPKGPGEPSSS